MVAWLMVVRLSLLLVLPVSLATTQHGSKQTHWTPEHFPNPQKDLAACGRAGVASSICDPDNILTREQQNMVDGLINEIARGQTPYVTAECGTAGQQGFQVAVAVFHRMSTSKHADKSAAAQHFARELYDRWGVGHPACQNGALVLLAVGDRQAYISTGAGVKAIVTDSQLLGVLDTIKPALQHKRYAEAILSCVHQLGLLLAGEHPEPPGVDSDDALGIFLFFACGAAAVMGWGWLSNRARSKRFKTCADKLAAIKRDQAAIRRHQYAASSCPICLEDFSLPLTAAGAAAAARAAAAMHAPAAAPSSPAAGPPTRSLSSIRIGSGATRRTAASASSAAAQEQGGDGGDDDAGPSAPLLTSSGTSSSAAVLNSSMEPPGSSSKHKASSSGAQECRSTDKHQTPLVLGCGHAFCEPCITKWLENHTNCPICRRDLDAPDTQATSSDMDGRPGAQPPLQQQQPEPPGNTDCRAGAAQAQGQAAWQRQVWLPELGFRLRRLRLMYPDLVTDPMLYAWEEDIAADRELDTSAIHVFDPARQQQLEHDGQGGASSFATFGGGSSTGGGGAGTSW